MRAKTQAEPRRQRREGERQYETIIEAIGEHEVESGRQEQVVVPARLQKVEPKLEVSELEAEHETPQIEHVVEREARRLDLGVRIRRRPGEAVIKRRDEH